MCLRLLTPATVFGPVLPRNSSSFASTPTHPPSPAFPPSASPTHRYAKYQAHTKKWAPADFNAELQRLIDAGQISAVQDEIIGVPRELKRSWLTLSTELGHGAFGQVFKALLLDGQSTNMSEFLVAAKTIRQDITPGARTAAQDDLLSEAAVMALVGQHSNLVSLIGVRHVKAKRSKHFPTTSGMFVVCVASLYPRPLVGRPLVCSEQSKHNRSNRLHGYFQVIKSSVSWATAASFRVLTVCRPRTDHVLTMCWRHVDAGHHERHPVGHRRLVLRARQC